MARQLKGKTESRTKKDKLYIPELDDMAKRIATHFALKKVKIDQSRSMARIIIEVKGDIAETTPKIQELTRQLLGE
mgnify:CR=1 FL=1